MTYPMHAIFFGLKRAFHASLRIPQRITRRHRLTPARFDMLYLVDRSELHAPQAGLRAALGVSRATVSRMLRSLEELGMIRRRRSIDHRTRDVYLTDYGRTMFRRAARELWGTGLVDLLVERFASLHLTPDPIFRDICTLDSHLSWLRRQARDSATLYYPWHPDD